MRALFVGLWKEWRDARGIAIALLVALPVLAFTAALAFGGEVPKPSFGGLSLFVVTVAQALFVLAVASESFGGERRRGTLDFVRRLPRGIGRAFAAKCGAYLAGTVLAVLWGALVAWTVCATVGPDVAVGNFAKHLLEPDPLTTTLALALFVLGLWAMFVSNLVPQGGGATVGAALLLGLLGVPVYLALKDHPWLLRMPPQESLRLGLLGLAAVGACALLVAFLRGCRLLGGIWAPAWRGLSVVLVLACGGYAWGAVALDRALTLDPSQPDFKFANGEGAYVGAGGRWLFVNVYRGDEPWHPSRPERANGTPVQPWIVDLRDGSWRAAGAFRQAWTPLSWMDKALPQPVLRRHDEARKEVGWFDGATGTVRKVLPEDVRTPDLQAWLRASMPALARHKDSEGRAAWLEDGRLVREGDDTPLARWFAGKAESYLHVVPDGWVGHRWEREGRRPPSWVRIAIDAASGEERAVGQISTHNELFLSTRTVLRRTVSRGTSVKTSRLLPWSLTDLVRGGEPQPTLNPPEGEELLIVALPGERALVLVGDDPDRRTLSIWDPRTGERQPLLDADGKPIVGQYASAPARAPGLSVVRVQVRNLARHSAAFEHFLLDDAAGRAWRLPTETGFEHVIAIEGPRSVLTWRRRCEVVRYTRPEAPNRAHAGFEAEVLFPR